MTRSTRARPNFPVYIVSKGRADTRFTAKALDKLNVPFLMVIEAHEFKAYAEVIGKDRLIVLDEAYRRDYETCDDLAMSKSLGPGPARNFAWDHAISRNSAWHWVLDDNITQFFRFNRNLKTRVTDGTIFRCMEDFVQRYRNVPMAGPNYAMFAKRRFKIPPYILNTRIYSCNLISNDLPFRWRGRYNEDTDLSLRVLKAGLCTVLFNAFLADKVATQLTKGGNTREFYEKEGTLPKSSMLVKLHGDVARPIIRFGREHHWVDYKRFKQKLVRRDDMIIAQGVDNYGMVLKPRGSNGSQRAKVSS